MERRNKIADMQGEYFTRHFGNLTEVAYIGFIVFSIYIGIFPSLILAGILLGLDILFPNFTLKGFINDTYSRIFNSNNK